MHRIYHPYDHQNKHMGAPGSMTVTGTISPRYAAGSSPSCPAETQASSCATLAQTTACIASNAAEEDSTAVLPPLDVDEGAHGVALVLRQARSPADALKDLKTEAFQLARMPRDWVRSQSCAPDRFGAITNFAGAAFTLPLAIGATFGGVQEVREALRKDDELHTQAAGYRTTLAKLGKNLGSATADDTRTDTTRRLIDAEGVHLSGTTTLIQHNAADGAIGASSVVAGASISLRTTCDTVFQIVSLSGAQSAAAGAAVTAGAAVGTIVLGPLAAGGAVALGWYFFNQAGAARSELQADQNIARTARNAPAKVTGHDAYPPCAVQQPEHACEADYNAFIEEKYESRLAFLGRFRLWNAGFLTGALISALGTAAKAAICIMAITGAAASVAFPPVLLGVILALVVVGGLTMLACSWHFIAWHGKGKRQQSYRYEQTRLLGRRLDGAYTAACPEAPARLRAAAHSFLAKADRLRKSCLHRCADDAGKHFAYRDYTRDPTGVSRNMTKEPRRLARDIAAIFIAAWHCMRSLSATDSLTAFAQTFRESFADHANRLTETRIARWLGQKNGENQRELVVELLEQELDYLRQKAALLDEPKVRETCELLTAASSPTNEEAEGKGEIGTELALDKARMQAIEAVLCRRDGADSEDLIHDLTATLLEVACTPAQSAQTDGLTGLLARYLHSGIQSEFKRSRGILFDMDRTSCRIVHKSRQENAFSWPVVALWPAEQSSLLVG